MYIQWHILAILLDSTQRTHQSVHIKEHTVIPAILFMYVLEQRRNKLNCRYIREMDLVSTDACHYLVETKRWGVMIDLYHSIEFKLGVV